MKEKTALYIKRGFGILLSLLVVLTGALLIQGCLYIYITGTEIGNPDPFSREIVAERFWRIAPVVFVTLASVIAGGVLHLTVFKEKEGRLKPLVSHRDRLKKAASRLSPDSPLQSVLHKHHVERTVTVIVATVLSVGATVPFWVHLSKSAHFTMDFNASVIGLCLSLLPFVCVSGGLFVGVTYLADASRTADILAVKEALQMEKPAEKPAEGKKPFELTLGMKIGIAVLAIVLIVLGIFNDGAMDVFQKAVRICTECIGLG